MPFSHVLVATDLSEPANYAVRYAIEEATLHRARVTLLHVLTADTGTDVYYVTGAPAAGALQEGVDPSGGGPLRTFSPSPPTVVRHDPAEVASTRLKDLVAAVFDGKWDVDVAAGQPAETIVRVALERNADLIVMGTHGRTGLGRVLLGSVAEKVVRLAPCPVLTVRYQREVPQP